MEWIQPELRLHQPSQTIDPTPQIRVPTGQVYRTAALDDYSARMIAWIVSGFAPVWMSTRSSPHWILTAVSVAVGLIETSAKHTSFSDTAAWYTFLCQL